jgi:anti-anti-sigma factor
VTETVRDRYHTLLDLSVHTVGNHSTVVIVGEVDHHTCETLRRVVHGVLAAGASSVTFDCSRLAFIDAGGLHVLGDVLALVDRRGGRLEVTGANRFTIHLLEVTGLAEHLLVR